MYRHEILLARSKSINTDPAAEYGHLYPPNFTHAGTWAKRARFVVVVHEVTGSPSAWSLTAQPQDVVIHDGELWRYQERRWFDVGEPLNIADNTTPLTEPHVFTWETENIGADIRLKLAPNFTGGTAPTLVMTITRELWG